MKRPCIVVTGASGHLGFHIAREAINRGWETRICVRSMNSNIAELASLRAKVFQTDLRVANSFGLAFAGADCLFHAAAENTTSLKHRDRILQNTLELTRCVLENAKKANIQKVVYTSSVVVLGRCEDCSKTIDENSQTPRDRILESPYVEGKVLADEYAVSFAKTNNLHLCRTYPSWLMGASSLSDLENSTS